MSYDATPPLKLLKLLIYKFALSYDLKEGKKSTPERTRALIRELANGRAGVEFLFDAGDAGARPSNSVKLGRCEDRAACITSGTLIGWGGSSREGKVSRETHSQRS